MYDRGALNPKIGALIEPSMYFK